MTLDNFDIAKLRKRYVGAEPLPPELADRIAGLHLHNSHSSVLLPGVSPTATWTEMGAPWIDRAILGNSKFAEAKIFSWSTSEMELGGFLPEIEAFLRQVDPARLTAWQMVLVTSGALKGVCTRYTSTEEFLDTAPEWRTFDVWMICIDHDFLYDTLSLFAALPLGEQGSLESTLGHLLRLLVHWPREVLPDPDVPHVDVPARLRSWLIQISPSAADLVDAVMDTSHSDRLLLDELLRVRDSPATRGLYDLPPHGGSSSDKQRSILLQWSKSMMFHFIAGHELGHFLVANRQESPVVLELYDYISGNVLKGQPQPPRSIDESCCDFFGSGNSILQASRFGVPMRLAISAIDWAWVFAATQSDVPPQKQEAYIQLLENRRRAIVRHRAFWNNNIKQEHLKITDDLSESFLAYYSALPALRAKLALIRRINTAVIQGRDPPSRMLTWIF